jgi:hypothetical protein
MQNNTALLLICIYAAFPMSHALAVLVWALRQRRRGQL